MTMCQEGGPGQMKAEKELVREISRIGRQSKSVEEAVELAQTLLAGAIGASVLVVRPPDPGIPSLTGTPISALLDSREFPFRGLYIAPLAAGGTEVGRLFACFGSFGSPGKLLQHLT